MLINIFLHGDFKTKVRPMEVRADSVDQERGFKISVRKCDMHSWFSVISRRRTKNDNNKNVKFQFYF